MQTAVASVTDSQHGPINQRKHQIDYSPDSGCANSAKRQRTDSGTFGNPQERLSKELYCPSRPRLSAGTGLTPPLQDEPTEQLPSPSLTSSYHAKIEPRAVHTVVEKRQARSLDDHPSSKRRQFSSEPVQGSSPIDSWLLGLPLKNDDFEFIDTAKAIENMSQPSTKRSRSSDSIGRNPSISENGTETSISRDKKYSVYKDVNYPVVLETKGSFLRPSKAGMADEDKELCQTLLDTSQPIPEDILFDPDHFQKFHANLRGRSEARICTDLHPRMVPSAENLYIGGREEFEGLIEGYNDPWVKSIPFYGPRPQPDHTYGFKWSNFTEQQRRKLSIEPTQKSYYTAREDIYFPFLTSEVKCGKQGLDLADRPNAHSMTMVLRGVVDLYRKAGRPLEVHRRVLGFSISHDDNGVRIYSHYPEIDGDKTTFWRDTLKEFSLGSDKGKDKWTCYQFTINVCQMFALPFIERLRAIIDRLPDPIAQAQALATTLDDISVQSSQDELSAPDSQNESFKKPRSTRGLNAELRNMIQSLQRQLEQQRKDTKDRETLLLTQLEQQRKDTKDRETLLLTQLEQQRKQSDLRQKELMEMLQQQSEQIKLLSQKQ